VKIGDVPTVLAAYADLDRLVEDTPFTDPADMPEHVDAILAAAVRVTAARKGWHPEFPASITDYIALTRRTSR
jgi:hypothetical protein